MKHLLCIILFFCCVVADAYERDELVLMLSSGKAQKIEESLAFLNQQAQRKIRGKAGQEIDTILKPARDYLAPYQEYLLNLNLPEHPQAVYLLGLTPPNEDTASQVLSYAKSGGSESIGLALTALASMNYNEPNTKQLIRDTINDTESSQNYRLAAEIALKWELLDLIPEISRGLQSDDPNVQKASASVLKRFELLTDEEITVQPAAAEIPTSPPAEVVETTEELPTVEPEVKEPAEVKAVEVAEETPEESSQWWFWLVGTLVVLGGLAVVVRRKS